MISPDWLISKQHKLALIVIFYFAIHLFNLCCQYQIHWSLEMNKVLMQDAAVYAAVDNSFDSKFSKVSGYSSTENKLLCQTRHTCDAWNSFI